MTTYYNLPVYKQSYDLLLEIFKLTKEFNREYKYTIGEELKKETTAMIINIYRANSSNNKVDYIVSARENIEVIRLLIRLLKDLKQIQVARIARLNLAIEELSKQLTGWGNYSKINSAKGPEPFVAKLASGRA
ncbi:MAG: four helix bundle protein [Candidatus Saccharibacteria bacterium]